MVIKKKKLKVLGIPIPGTAKRRRYKWEEIKSLPKWIKIRRPSSGSKLIKGKTYLYKVVGTTSYNSNKEWTPSSGTHHGSVMAEIKACTEHSYTYYRRKRGWQ